MKQLLVVFVLVGFLDFLILIVAFGEGEPERLIRVVISQGFREDAKEMTRVVERDLRFQILDEDVSLSDLSLTFVVYYN